MGAMSSTSNFGFLADQDPKLVQLVAGTTQAFPGLAWAMTAVRNRGAPPLAVAFMFLTVVHVIETGKFVAAWADYRTAVAALAESDQSDPVLGNPHFVSSERISASLNRLSWFSTTKPVSDCGELPAESVGDRHARVRRTRNTGCPRSRSPRFFPSGPGMGDDCGTKPGCATASGRFHVIDAGTRDRNRKIRCGLG